MNCTTCKICGGKLKKNGFTSAGRQRWRCTSCGASSVPRPDTSAKTLARFVAWLLSKESQSEASSGARTFRKKTAWCWGLWPVSRPDGVAREWVGVDGKWVGGRGDGVVLVAAEGAEPVAWGWAPSESRASWSALLSALPPCGYVVGDGMNGLPGAVLDAWGGRTLFQRCVFHVFFDVRRYTTGNPRSECGREALALARSLLAARDAAAAASCMARCAEWDSRWSGWLAEKDPATSEFRHARLRKARNSLCSAARSGQLFAFVEQRRLEGGSWPRTNNALEGGINSQIQLVWTHHRGSGAERRAKAAMWWLWMHSGQRTGFAEALRWMPRDSDLARGGGDGAVDAWTPGWGTGVDWNDYHNPVD